MIFRLCEIEARARAATPGRWHNGPHYRHTVVAEGAGEIAVMAWTPQGNLNADYVASLPPITILEFTRAIRAGRTFLDKIVALEPAVADAFAFRAHHGGQYRGENWVRERIALSAALAGIAE